MCMQKRAFLRRLSNNMGRNINTHENSDGSFSTKPKYCKVSKPNSSAAATPHIRANHGKVLMQVNATPHTARATQQVQQEHNIRLLISTL